MFRIKSACKGIDVNPLTKLNFFGKLHVIMMKYGVVSITYMYIIVLTLINSGQD